jgi:hypothetical protein
MEQFLWLNSSPCSPLLFNEYHFAYLTLKIKEHPCVPSLLFPIQQWWSSSLIAEVVIHLPNWLVDNPVSQD